ncbi:hypothetical protein AA18890_1511 [Komagataeibacter europaeus LMG 18890]|nr:hypothetical protein AA18890_1511 [Komagataeibacter europaeus LMG 18890]
MGWANPGPWLRNAVSCTIVRRETNGQNCLGNELRETGHNRLPLPPDRITGITGVEAGCDAACVTEMTILTPEKPAIGACRARGKP